MKNNKQGMMITLAAAGLAVALLTGGCDSGQDTANAKPYPLTTCIVSDEPLGSMGDPVVRVYEGQEVKFCCKSCIKDFDSDPAKYLAKLSKLPEKAQP